MFVSPWILKCESTSSQTKMLAAPKMYTHTNTHKRLLTDTLINCRTEATMINTIAAILPRRSMIKYLGRSPLSASCTTSALSAGVAAGENGFSRWNELLGIIPVRMSVLLLPSGTGTDCFPALSSEVAQAGASVSDIIYILR